MVNWARRLKLVNVTVGGIKKKLRREEGDFFLKKSLLSYKINPDWKIIVVGTQRSCGKGRRETLRKTSLMKKKISKKKKFPCHLKIQVLCLVHRRIFFQQFLTQVWSVYMGGIIKLSRKWGTDTPVCLYAPSPCLPPQALT